MYLLFFFPSVFSFHSRWHRYTTIATFIFTELSRVFMTDSIWLFLVEEYNIIVANGQQIHQIHFEGSDATTFTSNLLETVSGVDFLYK